MKKLLLLLLLPLIIGCTLLYDSRNQNSLNVGDASYMATAIKDGKFKTGRLIKITFFTKK